ncbi:MAG: pyruvate formate lyase family protein, partial [Planctomycetota bacterium]
QNVMVGGRDETGADLTCAMTHIVLDAFFETNDPQPALSVKLHAKTPEALYRSMGRFFFTPGHSTPSLLNDDTIFEMLRGKGVADSDLPDYSIAGCQEPLIMGKASMNTTNTWLNLAKVLELAANDGVSLISGRKIGPSWEETGFAGPEDVYENLEEAFYKTLDAILPRMREAGNACTTLLGSEKPVPFTSAVMDGLHMWRDMRDPEKPGTRYNAGGCLIHGLAVVADSIHAVRRALASGLWGAADIRAALQNNYEGYEDLRVFLEAQDKFGNNCDTVDETAARIANNVSDRVVALRNPAGSPYMADWSTPSTHLLYGWWVGATPDGRMARTMLNFGLDPRPETSRSSLPERCLSAWKMPYLKMTGGYASHIGLRPGSEGTTLEERGVRLRDRVIAPLFRLGEGVKESPFYVYFNVDTPDHLRKVLEDPEKYAPGGVYILRIHGTFVNFLDLSPAIQEDIIARLGAGGNER